MQKRTYTGVYITFGLVLKGNAAWSSHFTPHTFPTSCRHHFPPDFSPRLSSFLSINVDDDDVFFFNFINIDDTEQPEYYAAVTLRPNARTEYSDTAFYHE